MANKRMIAKMIIDSDAFLDMPQSAQNLYFHLNVRADDDGFLDNPKKVMRTIGSNQNDLELLLAKRYLLSFSSGVIVIKHWKLHNTIQKDRYKPTIYKEEKETLYIKENGAYTDRKPLQDKELKDGSVMDPEPIHVVNEKDSFCTRRLDKISIDQSNKDKEEAKPLHNFGTFTPPPSASDFQSDNVPAISEFKDMVPESDTELYNDIKSYFESKQPSGRFTNYGKEGTAIKGLIKKAKDLHPDDYINFLNMITGVFAELRKTDPFYTKQPFLPSSLNSSGIFDRVLNEAQTKYQEHQAASEFDAAAFWAEVK